MRNSVGGNKNLYLLRCEDCGCENFKLHKVKSMHVLFKCRKCEAVIIIDTSTILKISDKDYLLLMPEPKGIM